MKNHRPSSWLQSSGTLAFLLFTGLGCRPGYLKASDLESSGQGPAACAKSCEEIGMRMAALVLVSNSVPGCVCQPVVTPPSPPKAEAPAAPATPDAPKVDAPAPATPPGPAASDAQSQGAAAATTGFIVLAAAAAAQQAQQEHERRSQQLNY